MITALRIERFKSIKRLELRCRRINLFIGEPNTGKSNILEALGLLSWCGTGKYPLKEFVRFQLMQNLFYDCLTDEPVLIEHQGKTRVGLRLTLEREEFVLTGDGIQPEAESSDTRIARFSYSGEGYLEWHAPDAFPIKFYRFAALERVDSNEPGPLLPPKGHNLFTVIYKSKTLREFAAELFRHYGLAIVFKPHERAIELQKQQDGIVIAYPYALVSDTLQRTLFFRAAIESNRDAVLVFEEPEAHAFPYYTKHLGERIALDQSNQYFIATHNPYLLTAILEKANKEEVAVFATRYRDYATEAHLLTESQLARLLEADPFLGLEHTLEGG